MARRGAVGEFELIGRLARLFGRGGPGVVVGIGDDAAVLEPPAGERLVATVDAVFSGVHFGRGARPEDVGWKALAASLSDLAAMGARPLWALLALGAPRGVAARRLESLGRGLAECARRHRVRVVGGNVSRARDLSETVAALGAVRPGRELTRGGGRPGDAVLVSGTLGDAALGLEPGAEPALRRRQRRPEPRLALGVALGGLASACIDVSDGLLQDLGHLCRASGTGASLRAEALPLSPAYRRATRRRRDPWAPALCGGEDYELAFTVPPERVAAAGRAARAARTPVSVVGALVRGGGVRVVLSGGGRYRPRSAGHDHLASPGPVSDRGAL